MTPDEQSYQDRPGGVFRRILVGYDGSEGAQRALRVAIAMAGDLHGDVHALLVVRLPAHVETPEERERATRAERENLLRGFADIADQTQYHVGITTDVVFDNEPAKAIAHWAQEYGFDLIVVGGHGRERATHAGIGHSLEVLLGQRSGPVLVV